MFGWFRPQPPLDAAAKDWVERRLAWLGEQFGTDVFTRRALILPNEDFFPDRYDASDDAAHALFERICGYMDVDPAKVDLRISQDQKQLGLVNERGHAVSTAFGGLYDESGYRTTIYIAEPELHEPIGLVGTMAHELSHLKLLGEERIDPSIFDNELLTDLTALFFGFGIFKSNSTRDWQSSYSHWPGTTLSRPEYMNLPMCGYALAHRAWCLDERHPGWLKYLRPDARACCRSSLQYLRKTGDSKFRPPLRRRQNGRDSSR